MPKKDYFFGATGATGATTAFFATFLILFTFFTTIFLVGFTVLTFTSVVAAMAKVLMQNIAKSNAVNFFM
jgi:hypothetical protein